MKLAIVLLHVSVPIANKHQSKRVESRAQETFYVDFGLQFGQ